MFTIIAGAGISVSCGIPDFRSSKGLFKKKGLRQLFDAQHSFSSQKDFSDFLIAMAQLYDDFVSRKPSTFHKKCAQSEKVLRLYSQNIDFLEERAGIHPEKVVYLHGKLDTVRCTRCFHKFEMRLYVKEYRDGLTADCAMCKTRKRRRKLGYIRPDILLYNELDRFALDSSMRLSKDRKRTRVLVVIGTSCSIPGVRQIIRDFAKTRAVWYVNIERPPKSVEKLVEWKEMTADAFAEKYL